MTWRLLLAMLLAACAGPARTARAPRPDEARLSVLTWNVNFGLAGDPACIEAIARADADLVLLQETTPAWQAPLEAALARDYPWRAWHHSFGAGGLGVLSRVRLDPQGVSYAGEGFSFPAWRFVVHGALGPVQVLSVHLRPPVSDSGSWVSGAVTTRAVRERELRVHAAPLDPLLPTIVAGDFNEEDGRAVRLLRARGLRSALPEFEPRATTWRWSLPVGRLRARLDHVFYSPELEPLSARVLREGRSDHDPVRVVFVRAPAGGAGP